MRRIYLKILESELYMGRKSKYSKEQKKEEITVCEIKDKLGVVPLSTKEIAIYLNEYTQRECTYTEKTIKNYIIALCNESDGLLQESDFKKSPNNTRSKYEIKPEYHGLLLALIDTSYFDGRKNDRVLSTRAKLNGELLTNIETFLNEGDIKIVKANPAYVNARVENVLTEKFESILVPLIRQLFHSDHIVRHKMFEYVIQEMSKIYQHVSKWNSGIMSTKLVYASKLDDLTDAVFEKGLFQADTLKEYLVSLLAYRVHGKGDLSRNFDNNGELKPEAVYLILQMFNIKFTLETEADKILTDIDEAIFNMRRFQVIKEKAEKILDLDDPIESVIYFDLLKICNCYFVSPEVSKDEYQNIIAFIESIIANDMWDILGKFNSGYVSVGVEKQISTMEQLKRRIRPSES